MRSVNAVESLQLEGQRTVLKEQETRETDPKDLTVHGMTAADETILYFADYNRQCVKRLSLQNQEVETIYQSDWRSLNVFQFENGKSLILLEENPAKTGILKIEY